MSSFSFIRCRSLAMLLLISVPLLTAAADERGETHQLKTFFQVTVRQGPSAGLVASGLLTLNVKSGTGNFTGTLTPAEAEGADEPLSSVLFHQVDHKFVPDREVKEIDVRGTIHGHAINLVALNVGEQGKDIFGVGTSENTFDDQRGDQGLGQIAGPAVGPQEGDSGDWIESLQPISFRAAPVFTSASTTTFLEFQANSFTATTKGVPVPVFTETGTLPSGVTFGSNGVLSGTPTQPGTFPITIVATNSVLPDGVQNFTLVVNRPPPTFDSVLSPTPMIVASYSFGATQCPGGIAPTNCPKTLSMTVTSADNPSTFGAFVANATNAAGSGQHFSGSVAIGDLTIANSTNMVVTNVSLASNASGNVAATITVAYQ